MSAVLVTGGAGYIGSHAVRALGQAGHRVVVLDNLMAGHREAVGDATFVEADVRDTASVRRALREHRIEAVMHFAALLSVSESVSNPALYYECNVGGSLALLDAMASEGVQRFVLSSTCAVYGDRVTPPIDETHPTAPINAYGETKLTVERALVHYGRAYGLRSVALRYFNAAGADASGDLGEDHDPEIHLIPRAFEAARGGEPLQLFGDDYPTADGTCERDYVHVSDLASGHLLALDALLEGRPHVDAAHDVTPVMQVFNLGTGRPYSVRDVVRAVERVTQQSVPIVPAPRRPGDPAVLFASAARATETLGWHPRYTSLEEIVETAWRWHETHPRGFGG
ncbi:MAG: UDP-glucose 4-epimerase GalE [Acidobacteria bacterium]|nr:UDP-glucose 4-epimerase GalE [Acidobacteriota bacterium]